MDIQVLAQELENLTFENGHVFENGTPFRERLGRERAVGLLRALEAHGYQIVRDNHRTLPRRPLRRWTGSENEKPPIKTAPIHGAI
jgi:hypothetical protein